jgi:hypothetical protein
MTNRGAISTTISANSSYTIPAGYHNGSGKVSSSGLYKVKTGSKVVGGTQGSNNYVTISTGLNTVSSIKGAGVNNSQFAAITSGTSSSGSVQCEYWCSADGQFQIDWIAYGT